MQVGLILAAADSGVSGLEWKLQCAHQCQVVVLHSLGFIEKEMMPAGVTPFSSGAMQCNAKWSFLIYIDIAYYFPRSVLGLSLIFLDYSLQIRNLRQTWNPLLYHAWKIQVWNMRRIYTKQRNFILYRELNSMTKCNKNKMKHIWNTGEYIKINLHINI